MWPAYHFQVPDTKRVRYICHTDAKNEADDQFTIAHVLMTDKLDVKGIVGAHFRISGDPRYGEGMSAKASVDEINLVLDLMHLKGQVPVFEGAGTAMPDEQTPVDSEGARFIIEEALKEDDRPLYIGLQGSLTDLASAILIEPSICERMTAIWIGGGDYPEGGEEFNLLQDINAANVVFSSSMPLWQVTKSVYKTFTTSLAELQYKVEPHGEIGAYLFKQMAELNTMLKTIPHWPQGETWNLGDEGVVAALLEEIEQDEYYTLQDAPRVDTETMKYLPGSSSRKVRVYHKMNPRMDLEDLFCKLAINFPEKDS
ncbi:MAG: nucleoside hydrolase [Blautia sp.]|nr:nucleoside hydrolase [Blautia sp.]